MVKSKGITQGCPDLVVFRQDPSIVLDMVRGNPNEAAKVFVTGSQMRCSRNLEITSRDHNSRTLQTTCMKMVVHGAHPG